MTRTDIIDIIENALIRSTDTDATFLSWAKGVYIALESHKLLTLPAAPKHRSLIISHSDGGRTVIDLAQVASVTID